MNNNRKIKITLLLVIITWVFLTLTISCTVDRNDPGAVARKFMLALIEYDEDAAKSLTSRDQWSRIDAWLVGREERKCSESTATYIGDDPYQEIQRWHTSYQCLDAERPFCFSIEYTLLQKAEAGWEVVDWGDINEDNDYWCQ